jgi:hypothetical protein
MPCLLERHSIFPKIITPFLALVKATFVLLAEHKNPISPFGLLLTVDIII